MDSPYASRGVYPDPALRKVGSNSRDYVFPTSPFRLSDSVFGPLSDICDDALKLGEPNPAFRSAGCTPSPVRAIVTVYVSRRAVLKGERSSECTPRTICLNCDERSESH